MRSIDYFDRGCDLGPDRLALIDAETRFTFAEAATLTKRVAVAMAANGFVSQQPVALYAPNSATLMLALLSIWRANGKWIPVNTRNAIDANAAYLDYVGCEWMFYHSSLAGEVAELKARVGALKHFVCLDRPFEGDPCLDDFIAGHEAERFVDRGDAFGNLEDVVGIFPTGGTTGPSKGVNVTNLGWSTMLQIAGNMMGGRADDPRTLVVAPITHAAGPVSLATLALGSTQVILPGFDAEKVLNAIQSQRITHMYLPPTALYGLLDSPSLGKFDTSSLKLFLLVGSPVAPEKLRQAVGAFGPCMCQGYGQVEAPMLVSWLSPEDVARAAGGDHPERLASCGRPTYPIRVGVMGDDGTLLPAGARGEIVVRGALVSRDYFEKPEATAEVRTGGWHHTGDVGYRDQDGFLYIVDRKKDMVITGGFNVFSAEVEAAIMELGAVVECAVIGVPHAKWGEAVMAFVVRRGDIDEAAVIAHAKDRLGGVKAPKSVSFVETIPRTPAGKTDKKALRQPYWSGDRMVS
ncbi:MAG TPA: AMP-binding protein [Caulobacteraceae bacterium]